ncbi:hypothetical protein GQ457_16G012150 [Hibiscus cannabinus]
MSDPHVDPRLPKKQRWRDESLSDPPIADSDLPHAPMDCDSSKQPKPQASYKDMVTGSSDVHFAEELLPLDDDDIDLLEDDVSIVESEGIHFIVFSDRVQSLALKSMDYTLVVKVLGRRVGYNVLQNRIYSIWKLIDIENDYFLVKFSARTDYIRVMSDGPWMIFGHYLTVEPWSMDFNPHQTKPCRILAWVRLPGLPITCPPAAPEPHVASVPPQDTYGPWMLVEKRQHRQQKKPVALQSIDSDFHVESSRFNPIFLDSNDDDNQVNIVDISPIPVEVPSKSTGIQRTPTVMISARGKENSPINSKSSKSKGKAGVQIHKPPIVPLGTRKSNMPEPRNLDVSMSSSRGARSRAPTSILNPKKHPALSIPILAGPTAGVVSSPATNRSSTSADMVSVSNLSIVAAIQDQRRTRSLVKLEAKLLQDLELVLDQEEQLWRQKSRADWIIFGDRNTSFYHAKAFIRKRRNKILMLQIDEDVWCDDDNLLREAAVDYFENLFIDCPSPTTLFRFRVLFLFSLMKI